MKKFKILLFVSLIFSATLAACNYGPPNTVMGEAEFKISALEHSINTFHGVNIEILPGFNGPDLESQGIQIVRIGLNLTEIAGWEHTSMKVDGGTIVVYYVANGMNQFLFWFIPNP